MNNDEPRYTELDLMEAYTQGWSDCADEMEAPWMGNRAEWYVEQVREDANPRRDHE